MSPDVLAFIICAAVTVELAGTMVCVKLAYRFDVLDPNDADAFTTGVLGTLWPLYACMFAVAAPFWLVGRAAKYLHERTG